MTKTYIGGAKVDQNLKTFTKICNVCGGKSFICNGECKDEVKIKGTTFCFCRIHVDPNTPFKCKTRFG